MSQGNTVGECFPLNRLRDNVTSQEQAEMDGKGTAAMPVVACLPVQTEAVD